MKKSIISLALSLAIIFSGLFIPGVFALDEGETGGSCGENLTWSYNKATGILTIGGEGEMDNYGNSFTIHPDGTLSTAAPWKDYYDVIKTVVVENGVTGISAGAFKGCTALESAVIGSGVTGIGTAAFGSCPALAGITVDEGNTVFYSEGNCLIVKESKNLIAGCKNSLIPGDVESIGPSAFEGCSALTEITIPGSVTSIGSSAFSDCTGLKKLIVPEGVTEIGYSAFENVPNVVYSGTASGSPWKARAINGYEDGGLVYEDSSKTALLACVGTAQGAAAIPESVKSIGDNAFYNCRGLTAITVPDSVTSIGKQAFNYCTGMTAMTVPDSVTSIGSNAFSHCTGLKNITLSNNIEKLENLVFAYCALTSITIPESVKSIGDGAFGRCESLTDITIPAGVESIGENAFVYCTGLKNIVIPDGVKNIGGEAFRGCIELGSVYIGAGVTEIGLYAFGICSKLQSITVSESNAVYHSAGNCLIDNEGNLWAGCNNSVIPSDGSVKEIRGEAFSGRTGLTNIVIPEGVKEIKIDAFFYCTALTSVSLPASLEQIRSDAFKYCDNLEYLDYYGSEEAVPYLSNGERFPPAVRSEAKDGFIRIYFKPIKDNSEKGVFVVYDEDDFEQSSDELELVVNDFTADENRLGSYKAELKYPERSSVALYEIHMVDADGGIVQPKEGKKIKIKILAPQGIDLGNDFYVYHKKQDGKTEYFKFSNNTLHLEGEYIVFEISSFSDFVIVQEADAPVTAEPQVAIKGFVRSRSVDYKATVNFSAKATDAPAGAAVHWFVNGTDSGKGETFTVSKATASYTVQAKLIGSDGKVLAESGTESVSVNTGFFARLIAFFRNLFGSLPVITQG